MQLVKNSQANAMFGFSIVGFALPLYLLLLSGFPTVDALKVCTMIFVQIVSGALIWAQVMHPRQVDIVEGVGMGLALGSILAVIGHQLFLPTSLSDFGWLLPVVVAAITSVAWRSTKGSHKNFVLEDASGLFFVAFAVVLILKQWWWLLPLALPTGVALYLLSNSGRNKLRNILKPSWIFVTVFFVAATVLMVYLRQLNLDWWIRSWDVVYHESKSFSIAKFGPRENISLVGYSMSYHWLGNAWIGMNSVVSGLPSWLSVAQVTPIYSAVITGCTFRAVSLRFSRSISFPFSITLVYVFTTGSVSPSNPPNVIAIMWAFSALFVAFEFFQNSKASLFFLFSILGVAAFSGKVSAGFVVIAGFIIIDFWNSCQVRRNIPIFIVRTLFLAIIGLLAFFFIIGGPNRLGNNTFKPSLKGLGFVYGVEIDRSLVIFILGSLGLLLTTLTIALPNFLAIRCNRNKADLYALVLAVLLSGITPVVFIIDDAIFYFQTNALNLISVGTGISLIALLLPRWTNGELNLRSLTILFTGGGAIGIINSYLLMIDWRETLSNPGGPTPILVSIQAIFLASCFGLAFLTVKPSQSNYWYSRNFNRLIAFSFVAIAGIVVPEAFKTFNQFSQKLQVRSPTNDYVGSNELTAASNWLKLNSRQDEVLATNKFCIPTGAKNCIDPKFFGVSSTANRKVLVEGPYYIVGGPYFSDMPNVTDESKYPLWVQERLDLSRGFADRPTAEIAARLRELGVDWFYLFLDNTENRNWAPFATVEYQNSEVAILKLTDPSS